MDNSDFINGLYVNEAKPDFILCDLGIQADRFCEYVQANKDEKGNVRITVARSKENKLYAKLNTWQPTQQAPAATPPPVEYQTTPAPQVKDVFPAGGVLEDDVPFNRLGDFEQ